MTPAPHLIIALPITATRDATGSAVVDGKAASGLKEYAARWPGPLSLATASAHGESQVFFDDALGMQVSFARTVHDAVRQLRPGSLYFSHVPSMRTLGQLGAPYVLLSESTPATRLDLALRAHPNSGLPRLRMAAGVARDDLLMLPIARRARGIQCNGRPSQQFYRRWKENVLLFHDSRIRASDIPASRRATSSLDRPLRVAFTGRLSPEKGPDHAIRAMSAALQTGTPLEAHVFGDGPLRLQLEKAADPRVTFHGNVDFEGEWKPYFRDSIDVAILPHLQADPSCTYLETAALGVPVLGYDNAMLRDLVTRHGIGWTVRLGDHCVLTAQLRELATQRESIARAAEQGLNWGRANTMEQTFDMRVEHLLTSLS